jgi:hypothetical protein
LATLKITSVVEKSRFHLLARFGCLGRYRMLTRRTMNQTPYSSKKATPPAPI